MSAQSESATPGFQAKILILDDHVDFGEMLAEALRSAGHTVWCASKAANALQILRNEAVDVLVTDIVMPECDGIEMIQKARQIRPQLRMIAMSGGTPHSPLYLNIAHKLGATELLNKPFSVPDLLAAIARACA